MEVMIWLGFTIALGMIAWILSKDVECVVLTMLFVSVFGGLSYIAIGGTFEVKPTVTQIPIDNIQIVENGYVVEYRDIKKFLNKDEIKVEISDKNILVENKYEYSKVENQLPYSITPSKRDYTEYKLLIKSQK